MFRHVVSSLYQKVFIEFLADGRKLCVKTYKESPPTPVPMMPNGQPAPGTPPAMLARPKKYVPIGDYEFTGSLDVGRMPPPMKGKSFLPPNIGFFESPDISGLKLSPLLMGRSFRLLSITLLDLDDPSVVPNKDREAAVWHIGIAADGGAPLIYNAIAQNAAHDTHPFRSLRQIGVTTVGLVYQPFRDMPFEECSVTLKTNAETGFYSNLSGWKSAGNGNMIDDFYESLPKIELASTVGRVTADGWTDVALKIRDATGKPVKSADLVLQETGGYLPMRKIEVKNGEASFRVGALGLKAGQSFKVGVGLGNLPNLLNVPLQVG